MSLIIGGIDVSPSVEQEGGNLDALANEAFEYLITFAESAKQFERGEKYLLKEFENPSNTQRKQWLNNRLNQLYREALQHAGTVSLGEGKTLYKALESRLFAELAIADQNQRYQLALQVIRVYRTAKEKQIEGAVADLKAFAFDRLPPLLMEQAVNYDEIVREVSRAVHDLAGPRDGIAFLLDRAENEPDWMRYNSQNAWNQFGYQLADWRYRTKDLGNLEPRLLKFVVAEFGSSVRAIETTPRSCSILFGSSGTVFLDRIPSA